jgi:hypothetical protein
MKRVSILLIILSFTGCASAPARPSSDSGSERKENLRSIDKQSSSHRTEYGYPSYLFFMYGWALN